MADVIRGIRSLPLHELIGSTLVAIVRADAEAAKATIEFIQAVGFGDSASEDENGNQSNQLRLAEFRYQKRDENDQISEFVALVPILSLVPIPALQTKEARLAFSAKIIDITKDLEEAESASSASRGLTAIRSPRLTQLAPSKFALLAKPVAASGAKDQEIRGSFDLEIELTLGQADLPLGMEKIFNLMDQAIQDEKAPKPQ